ncbi:MAG: DUF1800 domain-containing protein [SAR202 cluster bacterium]|nr:DUF1800 domain-containing protein [SAR202 cluster bacterium]
MGRDIGLIAHLIRRAGFGAPYEMIKSYAAKGYEATVEELVDPASHGIPGIDTRLLHRYHPLAEKPENPPSAQMAVLYCFMNSPRPLEEKMTLFWHMVFATGNAKVDNPPQMLRQLDMFRHQGMGNYRDILIRLSKDPAMLYWLDNNQNHRTAPNENWGRELLELFSMGQGHYTEDDVKMAATAFTGWTMKPKLPRNPYGRWYWEFEYRAEDHDNGDKTFLGRTGRFNGEDIINIILEETSCHKFIARHLYNFFVEDEVQVPSWLDIPSKNPKAVDAIAKVFKDSNFELKPTLRFLFNSDFFKDEKVWFAKVKSPIEVVVGTTKIAGGVDGPDPSHMQLAFETGYQGQEVLDPPSVEGWHTGAEWINTGSLVRRVNFMAERLGNTSYPGVGSIVDSLSKERPLSEEGLVDGCLRLLGEVRVGQETRKELVAHAKAAGPLPKGVTAADRHAFQQRVGEMLQLIASTREYQFC